MFPGTSWRCCAYRRVLAVLASLWLMLPALGHAQGFSDLAALVSNARAAGEAAPDIDRITLAEGTSRELLRVEGDVDFPFSVGIDLPLNAEPRPLGTALTAPLDETGRYVVVFEVALAKSARKVRDVKDKLSRKITSVNRIDNPNYQRAVKQFSTYATKLERAPNNQKLLNLFEDARGKLASTPQFIEQPVYGDYAYKLADLECRKTLTVNYYVVDRTAKRFIKSVFDVVERENFTLAYNVDPSDPTQGSFRADIATEKQVKDWERAPVVIPLSQVLDKAVANGGASQPMASVDALLAHIQAGRSAASQRAFAETYDSRPLNDPRFDSVVAIYAPSGSMGSGFFVRSNVVMTNWHVVKGHPIVEMRLYDRRETFGQVIAKDVRLDLALVKVQDRGRPVEFLRGKDVLPGDRVEAIGHPLRQLFSITRGVVSSIRKQKGGTNETQINAAPVTYVQTDANTNPGNSGGPLFKGDKVAGVVVSGALTVTASGMDRSAAPGINFAVHYSEAQTFLNEALRGE
jgi:serine protease Do